MEYCKKCEYRWENRKENPKTCPRCKSRRDYPLNEKQTKLGKGEQ